MTSPECHTPTPCQYLGKAGSCTLHALYGRDVCWRRDGRPERKAGLSGEGWRSPFQYDEGEGEEE